MTSVAVGRSRLGSNRWWQAPCQAGSLLQELPVSGSDFSFSEGNHRKSKRLVKLCPEINSDGRVSNKQSPEERSDSSPLGLSPVSEIQ